LRVREGEPTTQARDGAAANFAYAFAFGCGVLALTAYYWWRLDAVATAAIVTGSLVLTWSIIWPS
jgi:hypothetical protein